MNNIENDYYYLSPIVNSSFDNTYYIIEWKLFFNIYNTSFTSSNEKNVKISLDSEIPVIYVDRL